MQKRQGAGPDLPAESTTERMAKLEPSHEPASTRPAVSSDGAPEGHPILAHHERVLAAHAEFLRTQERVHLEFLAHRRRLLEWLEQAARSPAYSPTGAAGGGARRAPGSPSCRHGALDVAEAYVRHARRELGRSPPRFPRPPDRDALHGARSDRLSLRRSLRSPRVRATVLAGPPDPGRHGHVRTHCDRIAEERGDPISAELPRSRRRATARADGRSLRAVERSRFARSARPGRGSSRGFAGSSRVDDEAAIRRVGLWRPSSRATSFRASAPVSSARRVTRAPLPCRARGSSV